MAATSVLKDLAAQIEAARKASRILSPMAIKTDMWQAPLCRRFITPFRICEGCPVMAKTGLPRCEGTPRMAIAPLFEAWGEALADSGGVTTPVTTAARRAYSAAVTAWADWLEAL